MALYEWTVQDHQRLRQKQSLNAKRTETSVSFAVREVVRTISCLVEVVAQLLDSSLGDRALAGDADFVVDKAVVIRMVADGYWVEAVVV